MHRLLFLKSTWLLLSSLSAAVDIKVFVGV